MKTSMLIEAPLALLVAGWIWGVAAAIVVFAAIILLAMVAGYLYEENPRP